MRTKEKRKRRAERESGSRRLCCVQGWASAQESAPCEFGLESHPVSWPWASARVATLFPPSWPEPRAMSASIRSGPAAAWEPSGRVCCQLLPPYCCGRDCSRAGSCTASSRLQSASLPTRVLFLICFPGGLVMLNTFHVPGGHRLSMFFA